MIDYYLTGILAFLPSKNVTLLIATQDLPVLPFQGSTISASTGNLAPYPVSTLIRYQHLIRS
jgi:hypothetical protein